jgi:hypothetical protein
MLKLMLFEQEKERSTIGGGGRRQRWSPGLCWWLASMVVVAGIVLVEWRC